MIERVYVLNLPHRVDRRYYMMGHLHAMNVYHHALHFFPAKYHGDFDSPDAVRAAAVADGFAAFDNERWKEERNKYTIIYHWGYACILRQVVDDNKNALVMIDDRVLRLEFPHLVNIVGVLEKDHPPFYFLSVGVVASTVRRRVDDGSGCPGRTL